MGDLVCGPRCVVLRVLLFVWQKKNQKVNTGSLGSSLKKARASEVASHGFVGRVGE